VAEIHRSWTNAAFSPPAVAQAELNWWVTRRLPNLNSLDQVAPLLEREYELRYGLRAGTAFDAAARRAEAVLMFDANETDPNIAAITTMLTESYTSLRRVLTHDNTPRD
jgi:hypothetical protein